MRGEEEGLFSFKRCFPSEYYTDEEEGEGEGEEEGGEKAGGQPLGNGGGYGRSRKKWEKKFNLRVLTSLDLSAVATRPWHSMRNSFMALPSLVKRSLLSHFQGFFLFLLSLLILFSLVLFCRKSSART